MERPSHNDPDYAFGQTMLTLRSTLRLTQAALAEMVGVSRRAIVTWEGGTRYPSANHLKKLIAFAVQQGAFPVGHEDEAIRSLWRASRQKVLFDEDWLALLLSTERGAPGTEPTDEHSSPANRLDWGDALSASTFYGRARELDMLAQWTAHEGCRVVGILGLGGIGKSALAVNLMHHVAPQFGVVIWRSLRDAPSVEAFLEDCLRVVAPQVLTSDAGAGSSTSERHLNTLLGYMRDTRVLLVLDNLETMLEEGVDTGQVRAGYEGFGRLLRQVAETEHRSCLIFTSREKPTDLIPLEGSGSPVRVLRLARLEAGACDALLAEKGVKGISNERVRLINAYDGNPLALKIVAQTIVDLFGGAPGPFLEQGGVIFGGVRDLLARQFNRLSPIEQRIMIWLAILREPVGLKDLQAVMVTPVSPAQLLEALEALHRRSLVERSNQPGHFTLQSVVLEYVILRLITDVSREIEQERLERMIEHALEQAQAPDYVRQTQERLIVAPLLAQLHTAHSNRSAVEIEERLLGLLAQLRILKYEAQGYAPANLVTLLRVHRGDLDGMDLSGLALRGAYLQGVEMHDASLAGSSIRDSVFTEAFDGVMDLSLGADGRYLAACTQGGTARAWETDDLTLQRLWESPGDGITRVEIAPDGTSLACGHTLGEIKLWNIENGTLLWSSGAYQDMSSISTLAFSPDGSILAVGDSLGNLRLWDPWNGILLQVLPHDTTVNRVVWSPDGHLLAAGLRTGKIYLWQLNLANWREQAGCVRVIDAHTRTLSGLEFSSTRRAGPSAGDVATNAAMLTLASSSFDGTIKLWDPESGQLREILAGHPGGVSTIALGPDGKTLATGGNPTSGSADSAIWVWDLEKSNYKVALRGHEVRPGRLAFMPDGATLISGAEDGTLRLWDVTADGGRCLRILHGYVTSLAGNGGVTWKHDGTQLISCSGEEGLLTLFDVAGTNRPREMPARNRLAINIAWSPDGRTVAIVAQANSIDLWDLASGERVEVLKHSLDPTNNFHAAAWSPDGKWLAAITARYGLLVWDVVKASLRWPANPWPASFFAIPSWHPDGKYVASGGVEGAVHIWDASNGNLVKVLDTKAVDGRAALLWTVSWNSDGSRLLSCGRGSEGGALLVWDPWTGDGEIVRHFSEHPGSPAGAVWGKNDEVVVSAGTDRILRWWSVESGECLWTRESHSDKILGLSRCPDGSKLASYGHDAIIMVWDLGSGQRLRTLRSEMPYERLNIAGIQGLTAAQKATLRALGAVEDDDTLQGAQR